MSSDTNTKVAERGSFQSSSIDKPPDKPDFLFDDGLRRVDFVVVLDKDFDGRLRQKNQTCRLPNGSPWIRGQGLSQYETARLATNNNAKESFHVDLDVPSDAVDSATEEVTEVAEEYVYAEDEVMRQAFIGSLGEAGLEVEISPDSRDDNIIYYKIHAPWETRTRFAEVLQFKMPILDADIFQGDKPYAHFCQLCTDRRFPRLPRIAHFYTAAYIEFEEGSYLVVGDEKDHFFSPGQRSIIVDFILSRAVYDYYEDTVVNKKGVTTLISMGVFHAAFPLHSGNSGSFNNADGTKSLDPNLRYMLYQTWRETWVQPLDHLREYFGTNIAFYLSWLDFLTKMLVPAALVGVFAVCFGVGKLFEPFIPNRVEEICDTTEQGNRSICKPCNSCNKLKLEQFCDVAKTSAFFDNEFTIINAVFMAFWSVTFLRLWSTVEARERFTWHVDEYHEREETRPQFLNMKGKKIINETTDQVEPDPSKCNIGCRYMTSSVTMFLIFMLALLCAIGVVLYRVVMTAFMYLLNSTDENEDVLTGRLFVVFTSGCINLMIIVSFDYLYEHIASFLTSLEMPRTQSQWDNQFISKLFVFRFFNNNFVLFYIAFFKGKIAGYPGNYNHVIGIRFDEYGPEGTLSELCIILAVTMIGKQIYDNVSIDNLVQKCWKKDTSQTSKPGLKQWERDYSLEPLPDVFVIYGYVDMITQYAFVAMFAVAFPLAPMIALLISVVRIKLDTAKILVKYRRPVAKRTKGIGIWNKILQNITVLAVLSNAMIIAFSTEFIPEITHKYLYKDNLTYTEFSYSIYSKSKPELNEITTLFNKTDFMANHDTCYYRGFRQPPWSPKAYEFSFIFWQVLAIRLIFVMIFCTYVAIYFWLLAFVVPDMSRDLENQVARENHVAREVSIRPGRYHTLADTYAKKKEGKHRESRPKARFREESTRRKSTLSTKI